MERGADLTAAAGLHARKRALQSALQPRRGRTRRLHPSLTACSLHQPRERAVLPLRYAIRGDVRCARLSCRGQDGSEGMTRPDSPKEWTTDADTLIGGRPPKRNRQDGEVAACAGTR